MCGSSAGRFPVAILVPVLLFGFVPYPIPYPDTKKYHGAIPGVNGGRSSDHPVFQEYGPRAFFDGGSEDERNDTDMAGRKRKT
jgi:hypothetical protein